jgi:hypothetical protein
MANKRGNVALEVTLILVVLVSLIVTFPIMYSHLNPVITGLTDSEGFSANSAGLERFNDRLPRMLDNIFLLTFVFLWIGGVMLIFLIDSHPVFFGISLVLIIVVLWCSVFLGNFVEDFVNQDVLTLSRNNMPVITFVSSHVLEFMIAISFTMLLALYGKSSRGGF